ncbi:MAG: hypothetical protein ABFS14_12300 [Gemmatimonadota bacterium]
MTRDSTSLLLLHGVIVLFLGALTGIPYWIVVIREWEPDAVRAWRVAHALLVADGVVMVMVALALPVVGLTDAWGRFVAWNLIVSGYGFAWAFLLGAVTGHRALTPTSRIWDLFLFPGHFVGAVGSLLGLGALLLGLL